MFFQNVYDNSLAQGSYLNPRHPGNKSAHSKRIGCSVD